MGLIIEKLVRSNFEDLKFEINILRIMKAELFVSALFCMHKRVKAGTLIIHCKKKAG
jgi:hypothetical protein